MIAEDYLNERGIYNHPRILEHDVAELMEGFAKEKLQEANKKLYIIAVNYENDNSQSQGFAVIRCCQEIESTIKELDQ